MQRIQRRGEEATGPGVGHEVLPYPLHAIGVLGILGRVLNGLSGCEDLLWDEGREELGGQREVCT